MARAKTPPDQVGQEAEDLVQAGTPVEQAIRIVADRHGLSHTSVRGYRVRMLEARPAPPPKPVVLEAPTPPRGAEAIWDDLKATSRAALAQSATTGKATIEIAATAPVAVAFFFDVHIGSGGTDHVRAEADARLVADTPGMFALAGGDLVDNFILPKMLEPIQAAVLRPEEQWAAVEHYLRMFGEDKILAMVAGNHERWTAKVAAIDVLGALARRGGILYDPHEFEITLRVGDVAYNVLMRHKARGYSYLNATHGAQQTLRRGDYSREPDIVVVGHQHTPEIKYWVWAGESRVSIMTGTYKVADDYAREHAMEGGGYMVPCVVLNPWRREMTALPTLEAAREVIAAGYKAVGLSDAAPGPNDGAARKPNRRSK